MSDQITLEAQLRTEFGKGAARRLRREGKLPAVVYGHGQDVQHIEIDAHATFLAIKGTTNLVLNLDIKGKETMVLVKDVQVDPIRRVIEHIDFIIVKKGEKVIVDVPLILEGEVKGAAVPNLELMTIQLQVPATDIPEHIIVNIEGLSEDDVIRVSDLVLPKNADCELDPEETVVTIAIPAEEPEAEAEDGEASEGEAHEEGKAEEE